MDTPYVYTDHIDVSLKTGIDIVNIATELEQKVAGSKIINGVLNATVIGSTGSITTIEFEPGVVQDLKRAINTLAPQHLGYEHEKAWHDGNGHSHVQAALLGPSVSLPIRNGMLALGTWQQPVIINHDNKARKRRIEITVTGIK